VASNFISAKFCIAAGAIISVSLLAACGGGNSSELETRLSAESSQVRRCEETVATCLIFTERQVTKYKGGRTAAASYTFDDGLNSAFQVADIFDEQKLHASFYINPGMIHGSEWQLWRAVSVRGHEIGNHSMTHLRLAGNVSDATLKNQITDAQTLIEQQIGVRPLIFVFPFDAWDDRSTAVASASHIATRLPGFKGDPLYRVVNFVSTLSIDEANLLLAQAIDAGAWFVGAGHGVDGNGWSPITSDLLKAHLRFARSNPNLWIDTFYAVTQYRLCRLAARTAVKTVSADDVSLRLDGDFPEYCTVPLTVSIPVNEAPKGDFSVRSSDDKEIPSQRVNNRLLFDLMPDAEVHLTLKPKQP
jgi:peptidoglycan/xylan/chitin deacetylase (PgdA/CDA1 family)